MAKMPFLPLLIIAIIWIGIECETLNNVKEGSGEEGEKLALREEKLALKEKQEALKEEEAILSKRFKDKTDVVRFDAVHQILQRLIREVYGGNHMNSRSEELTDLMEKPPRGTLDTYCTAMKYNSRALYNYGAFMIPEISFMFYKSFGQIFNIANSKERQFSKYFDWIADHSQCPGEGAEILVQRLVAYHEMDLYDTARLEKESGILEQMVSLKTNLHHLMTDKTIKFQPLCNETVFKKYLNDKMSQLRRNVFDRLDVKFTTDQELFEILFEYRQVTAIAVNHFICIGFRGMQKDEISQADSIIYLMRDHFNKLMKFAERREENIMNGLKPISEKLHPLQYYRHHSVVLPANVTVMCGGGEPIVTTEESVFNTYHCGRQCKDIIKTENKLIKDDKKIPCGELKGRPLSCDHCYVILNGGNDEEVIFSKYAGVMMTRGTTKVLVLPNRNVTLPKLTLPELNAAYMKKLLKTDMIPFKKIGEWTGALYQDTPRKFYQEPRHFEDVDWSWLCWSIVRMWIILTVVTWTAYFGLGNYPYIRRWWINRQRRRQE